MNPRNDADDGAPITCASCEACCCRLEVLLMGDDAVPPQFSARDRWGGSVMRREDDGWCAALDRNTMRCTIYARRPTVCREFPVGESDCIEERRQLVARPPDARAAFASW